jgi:hypothetical protein
MVGVQYFLYTHNYIYSARRGSAQKRHRTFLPGERNFSFIYNVLDWSSRLPSYFSHLCGTAFDCVGVGGFHRRRKSKVDAGGSVTRNRRKKWTHSKQLLACSPR